MRHIVVHLSEEDFERIRRVKERLGLSWRDFLLVCASEGEEAG